MKRKLIITISICAIFAVGAFAYSQWTHSRRVSEDSAQRALLVELGHRLDAHFKANKSYPQSLAELPAHSWPDGSSPATLRTFRFESDGASFTLSCTSAYDGRVFTVQRYAGITQPVIAPAPSPTSAPTNAVGAGSDSAAGFTLLLEQRWPLDSIRDFCIPERRHNPLYQLLVPMPPSPVWQGVLHAGRDTGFDKISWYASITNGHIYKFSLHAERGTNFWSLEGGTVEMLKTPPAVSPDPMLQRFIGHK